MTSQKIPSTLSVVLAYVAGIAYWLSYFVKGAPTFTANDWLKEQVFSNLIRDSLNSWQLPWRISVDFYHTGVFELMANPEISLTPDFLLLGWVPNNTYFLIHWLVFFTLGFVGTFFLSRKYQLSSMSFMFFVAIFNFNGFIGAHIAEGHMQWASYFLFPWFFYWLSGLSAENLGERKRSVLKISLLIGFMYLNGSLHIANWCLMLMVLMLAYKPDLLRPVGLVVVFSGLLGAARLIPAAVYFPAKIGFVSGYPSLVTLLDALTYIYDPANPARGGGFGNLAWWEYNLFIGYIGFVFLVTGAVAYYKAKLNSVPSWWVPAGLVMALFAMGDVFQLIPNSGLPFATLERVASRFMIVPFILLLIIASVGVTNLETNYKKYMRLILPISGIALLGEFFQNARKWRIQSYEMAAGAHDIPAVFIVESHDRFLQVLVAASWAISVCVLVLLIVALVRTPVLFARRSAG